MYTKHDDTVILQRESDMLYTRGRVASGNGNND